MNKLLPGAGLVVGLIAASCSGNTSSALPPTAPLGGANFTASSAMRGMGSARVAAPSFPAPAGFAATATGAVAPAHATDLGRLAASQRMTVRIGLQLRNVAQLRALIASHRTVSKSTFVADFAPSKADVQKVVAYLGKRGFSHVSVEPNDLLVSADAKASQVESAFRTQLHAYAQNGASVYANVRPAYVPEPLHDTVVAVLGLNSIRAFAVPPRHLKHESAAPAPRPAATTSPSPCSLYGLEIIGFPTPVSEPAPQEGCLRTYYPADFQRAYDVGSLPAAKSVSIAIMAEGNVTQSIADLRTNEQNDLLPQVTVVVKPVGTASTDTSGDDEWTLDMLASSGMAQSVKKIYLYDTTSLTDSDITLEYSKWVSDDLAPIGNSSFGGCEFGPYLDGSMVMMDELLNEGAAQGQTMFASSGDTGAYCPVGVGENGVPAGVPMVNYPASSPYTAAVGGTTLVTMSDGSYQGEAAWYSTGGGLSQFEYAPTWEASEQPVAQNGESERGVPDVVMDGDLQTGMNIYLSDESGWTVIGGTSLASPLAAGSWARVEQTHGALYAPPLFYQNFSAATAGSAQVGPPPWKPVGAFHNVLVGCNGLYCAAPGYSYAAGLGSFDITLLSQQI